jgi:hypothetical protein
VPVEHEAEKNAERCERQAEDVEMALVKLELGAPRVASARTASRRAALARAASASWGPADCCHLGPIRRRLAFACRTWCQRVAFRAQGGVKIPVIALTLP